MSPSATPMVLVLAFFAILTALLALALGAIALLFRRYASALEGQVQHERALGMERQVRILELEALVDRIRVAKAGVELPDPAAITARAHAAQVEVAGQSAEPPALPPEIAAELAAIEDPEHRAELQELAQYRLANGESPEQVLSEVF
jgi:hypothetical protein